MHEDDTSSGLNDLEPRYLGSCESRFFVHALWCRKVTRVCDFHQPTPERVRQAKVVYMQLFGSWPQGREWSRMPIYTFWVNNRDVKEWQLPSFKWGTLLQ